MTLYFNLIYFPCWLAVGIIILFISHFIESKALWAFKQYNRLRVLRKIQVILMVATVKFSLLNYLYKFVLVTILVAVIIIEVMSKCDNLHSSDQP